MTDARHARAVQRAAQGARDTLNGAQPRPRTGRRTLAVQQQAIASLINLRNDVSLGLPHAALLERIDDELFKLKNPKGTSK